MNDKSTKLSSSITPEIIGLIKKPNLNSDLNKINENNSEIKSIIYIDENNKQDLTKDLKQNGTKQEDDSNNDIEIIKEIRNIKEESLNDFENLNDNLDKDIKKEDNESKKSEEYDLENEEAGFPKCMQGWVIRGKAIPINKKTWTEINIDGNDAILDCPSQVVPLLIKKPNIFLIKEEKNLKKPVNKHEKSTHKENDNDKIDSKKIKENINSNDNDQVEIESKNDAKVELNNDNIIHDKKESESIDKKTKLADSNQNNEQNKLTMLTIPDFYKSSIGSFLLGIGLSRCKEVYLKDSCRQIQKLIKKEGELEEHLDALKEQQKSYDECKSANSIYTFKMIKCTMCDFKTESEAVMDSHLSIPHLSNRKEFRCNFCNFVTRDARTINYHFSDQHKKQCNIQMPPHLYRCPTCNYESNQKAKAANHMTKCIKVFNEDKVQQTLDIENEYPCITAKPITQDDLKLYETTVQALRPVVINPGMQLPFIPGLPRGLQQQMLFMQQQQFARQKVKSKQTSFTAPRNILPNLRPNNLSSNVAVNMANLLNSQNAVAALATAANANGGNLLNNLNFAKTSAPQLYHMLQAGSHPQLTSLPKQNLCSSKGIQLNNRILPPSTSSMPILQKTINSIKPTMLSKNSKETNGGKSETFVICEICDGYIKDLEQLRTHMQWIHKVKIHPKMLASRPPLNCQKCQWRFFTDQGLERHLLGAHGLVTSNMQDLVDQLEDGGRCTICGRAFSNKLVAHMNQVHKITLRPAHLSYKCTVCSATFNLYRLFENHVYMVHSGSVKRVNEDQSSQLNKKSRTTIEIKTAINSS